MKIIILGCNQVSASLAENLTNEATDITLVDPDGDALRELKDRLDIGIAQGWPSHPDVLRAAGAEDADMIIAVTENDEVNMMACQIAFSVFKTPKKICRLRSSSYINQEDLFRPEAIPLDVVISPELLVSNYIHRLIELPGSLQVLDFADGNAQLVGVRAYYGGPLVGQEIRFLREHMPNVDARVAAIFRRNRAITPEGSTVIEADDEVFFIAAPKNIRAVMSELRRMDKPYKRVIIAGGGNIGVRLAAALEKKYQVKVIDANAERCTFLSEFLNRAIVLQGFSSDKQLLLEEGIEDTDVFLALTNDDEANIMSSMLAKRLGARKVMCLINNPAYVDLVQGGEIDIAISPQQASIGSLLTHIRRGDIVNVHSLRRGAAESLEAIAHGDSNSSKVVGRALEDIDLPPGTTIGAIVRNEEVLIAHDDIVIEPEDHVILFLTDKKRIADVERLFAVGLTFF
ncbi:potassium transporter inner membrane associated protein [Pseudohongiella nitratireducens]|uniref:Trk system potassium uptake protein TrkA n=1 Tax=Pseudohongiella nitratireducens TaxID=1768907 RepID=A0A917GW81_9GAMM|nr:Trk system potassium transporter TrkA [Pseudohongiella nitratireducens]GGG59055.1 potassium transporter inner membrane associated protein [Pseudohongiella nitratireducens]